MTGTCLLCSQPVVEGDGLCANCLSDLRVMQEEQTCVDCGAIIAPGPYSRCVPCEDKQMAVMAEEYEALTERERWQHKTHFTCRSCGHGYDDHTLRIDVVRRQPNGSYALIVSYVLQDVAPEDLGIMLLDAHMALGTSGSWKIDFGLLECPVCNSCHVCSDNESLEQQAES